MKHLLLATAISSALLLTACSEPQTTANNNTQTEQATTAAQVQPANPLFVKSALQYETPDFNAIKDEHFLPAFNKGMTEQMAEVQAIINNPAKPDFTNTIVALEKSGELLTRTRSIFYNLAGSDSNPTRREIQKELAPKMAAHNDNIFLNKALFDKVAAIHAESDMALSPEETRLLDVYYKRFVRAGAQLNDQQKQQIRDINT
ncbi:MAG: dipeptidyl carboxypeptidase II, partial [Pseudoalteromonas sp.]